MTKPLQTPMLLSSYIFKIKTNVQCKKANTEKPKRDKYTWLTYFLTFKYFLLFLDKIYICIKTSVSTMFTSTINAISRSRLNTPDGSRRVSTSEEVEKYVQKVQSRIQSPAEVSNEIK